LEFQRHRSVIFDPILGVSFEAVLRKWAGFDSPCTSIMYGEMQNSVPTAASTDVAAFAMISVYILRVNGRTDAMIRQRANKPPAKADAEFIAVCQVALESKGYVVHGEYRRH
jgi:hypothetical protein